MLAAAGRLDGSRELEPAVFVDVRVLLQRRELRPARHGEVELREDGAGGGGGGPPRCAGRPPRPAPAPPPPPPPLRGPAPPRAGARRFPRPRALRGAGRV